jgi:hypothetical protein
MNVNPALAGEIARIEGTLRGALEELAERLNSGERGPDTDDLVQHCREMAELLTDAVGGAWARAEKRRCCKQPRRTWLRGASPLSASSPSATYTERAALSPLQSLVP